MYIQYGRAADRTANSVDMAETEGYTLVGFPKNNREEMGPLSLHHVGMRLSFGWGAPRRL
jgi:hypothetical protein